MKKIWILSIAAALAVSLTACGMGDVSSVSSRASSAAASSQAASSQAASLPSVKVEASSVSDDLTGLQKYVAGNAAVTGTADSMRADMVGAKSGVRYKYSYGGGKDNVTLELYEFDTANLNDTAKKLTSEVKSSGKFTLLGQQVDAVLSKSGKYLMIYKNTASDDANKAYGDSLKKLFTDFKAD